MGEANEQYLPEKNTRTSIPTAPENYGIQTLLRQWGKPTERRPTVAIDPETLIAVRDYQIERMVSLGFHRLIGLSEKDYMASLAIPIPAPRLPDLMTDGFAVVDPRLPLDRHKLALGIDASDIEISGSGIVLEGGNNSTETPKVPYIIWVNTGIHRNPAETALQGGSFHTPTTKWIQEVFWKQGVRGLTVAELLSLYREQPADYATVKGVYALDTTFPGQDGREAYVRLFKTASTEPTFTYLEDAGSILELPSTAPSTEIW